MFQYPFVADVVKAPFDVTLQHPLGRPLFRQILETLFNGILWTAACAETVGARVSSYFRQGFQCKAVKGLHRPVQHGRNTEGAHFAVFLRNIYPLERFGMVSCAFQSENCFILCFWSGP